MKIRVIPSQGVVEGRSRVDVRLDRSVRRIVFRLWPNGSRLTSQGASITVTRATLRRMEARVVRPDPTTLVFELPRRLAPGLPATALLKWRLDLPGPILDRISQNVSAIRLGSFFPILSWESERGWATDPPTTTLAESSTSPTADFEVSITAPRELDVLATGSQTGAGTAESRGASLRTHWEADAVRDFAVALGDFDFAERTVAAPEPVRVRVGVDEGLDASPGEFLDAIDRALRDLANRYGPYPWDTFSMAILPDLGASGIEYPTMVFQGEDSLRHATTHEVAHSWFYALVGNNQARDPWLDEGITSWAQARSDGIMDYFRDFDVDPPARRRLGAPMSYWDGNEDAYYAGVYAQGVKALDSVGRGRDVDCALRRYVAANAYGVATTSDLVDALEAGMPQARSRLRTFGIREDG